VTALALRDEDSIVYRIGYRPDPFAWTPWQYATDGRFQGRWDDNEGRFRTLYVADRLLGCLLEVLADFRPDLTVVAALHDIDGGDDDDAQYPTAIGGTVPRSWLTPRTAGQAIMTGHFTDVSDARTISVLRNSFAGEAVALGLTDFDAAVLKLRAPRTLTQQVAGWMYQLRPPPDGVGFGSRHDDEMKMWAIFEQPGEDKTGSHVLTGQLPVDLAADTPELLEAFDIFGLTWSPLNRAE